MHNKNTPLEKKLEKSMRKNVSLSAEKKVDLFARIMKESETTKNPVKVKKESMHSFWKWLFLPTSGVAIAVAAIVIVLQNNENSSSSTSIATNQEITPYSDTAILPYSFSENAYTNEELYYHTKEKNLLGFGGGGNPGKKWFATISADIAPTQSIEKVPLWNLEKLSSDELALVAKSLFITDDLQDHYTNKKNEFVYKSTEKNPTSYSCIENSEKCALLSSSGFTHIEYDDQTARSVGEIEKSILAITGSSQIVTRPISSVGQTAEEEYNIHVVQSLNTPIPYFLPPLYISTKNNRVVSFLGDLVKISSSPVSEIDIISEKIAAERLQEDFIKIRAPFSETQYTFEVMKREENYDPNAELQIDFSQISLEYHRLKKGDVEMGSEMILFPFYRFSGVDKNSGKKIDLFVDASTAGNIKKEYRFID